MVKIGLVGCGMWGRNLARNLAQLDVLAAVADRTDENAAAFAAQFNSRKSDWGANAGIGQHGVPGSLIIVYQMWGHRSLSRLSSVCWLYMAYTHCSSNTISSVYKSIAV